MDFKKKMKIRFILAICYMIFGILMIVAGIMDILNGEIFSSLGLMFAVMGAARLRQYMVITKNEETFHKREILENDERNIMISIKSKSLALSVYAALSGIAVIVLYILKMEQEATIVSYSLMGLVLIYWVSYFIMRKKY